MLCWRSTTRPDPAPPTPGAASTARAASSRSRRRRPPASRASLSHRSCRRRGRGIPAATLAHAQQYFHGQLVESLVSVALRAQGFEIELLGPDRRCFSVAVANALARRRAARSELAEQRLDLR